MRLGARVDDAAAVAAVDTAARLGALARRRERRQVGEHAAARERPPGGRVADQVADPAQRLPLHQVGGGGAGRQVDVVRAGQRVSQDAQFEARRADVAEEARPRVGQALVQDLGHLVERGVRADAGRRQPLVEQGADVLRDRGLVRPGAVESAPRLEDEREAVLQRLGAGLAEGERRVVHACIIADLSWCERRA